MLQSPQKNLNHHASLPFWDMPPIEKSDKNHRVS